jgi:hypothetical protein
MILYSAMQYVSAAFAFAAAILWWKSAIVKTPDRFSIHVLRTSGLMAQPLFAKYVGHGHSPELENLGAALISQSRWNGWGAKCAAVAATLQGTAVFIQT